MTRTRNPDAWTSCSICGCEMRRFASSAAVQTCRPCRRAVPIEARRPARDTATCERCAAPITGQGTRFCSRLCANRATAKTIGTGPKRRRRDREVAAPGLSEHRRAQLLRKWRAQGRECAYGCGRIADTVDHIVPLVRGGTNFEGNLAPACRFCNGSKAGRLLVEWRLRHGLSSAA